MKHFIVPLAIPFVAAAQFITGRDITLFNLPAATAWEIVGLLFLCCVILAAFIVFEVVRNRIERTRESKAVEDRFADNARRFGLLDAERRLLRGMARHYPAGEPNELFESLTMFEHCVEGEAAEALSYVKKDEELEELEGILLSIRKKFHFTVVEPGQSIVSTRNLSSGQGLWLLGPKKTILGEAVVANVHELFFSIKIIEKEFGNLPAFESVVRFAFTRKGDGIYGVEAPLVSFDPGRGVVKCRHTLEFKRNQLRQDVRVETDMMVNIRLISTAKDEQREPNANFMVKMTDLSGGGFAFIAERKFSPGDVVMLTISSSRLTIGGIQTRILGFHQNKTTQKYQYHAQFVNIEFEKKEKIIKFVFNRLRELTQK